MTPYQRGRHLADTVEEDRYLRLEEILEIGKVLPIPLDVNFFDYINDAMEYTALHYAGKNLESSMDFKHFS